MVRDSHKGTRLTDEEVVFYYHVRRMCKDTSPEGYVCNRPLGHEGEHVAICGGHVCRDPWFPDDYPHLVEGRDCGY